MITEYPETHQQGILEVNEIKPRKPSDLIDFGVQIAADGRVWICINGQAFIRFKPKVKANVEQRST